MVVAGRSNTSRTNLGVTGLGHFVAHRRKKADKRLSPAILGSARTERVAEKIDLDVVMLTASVGVLTVNDLGFLRVEFPGALFEMLPNRRQYLLGL